MTSIIRHDDHPILQPRLRPVPAPTMALPAPPVDVDRLAELAEKLWWLAQVRDVLITDPTELDPCSDCPEPRYPDEPSPAPSDAVIVYRVDGPWVYRDAVCVGCLTTGVRDRARRAAHGVVVVEVPAVVAA